MSVRHTRGPGNHGYLKGGNHPPEYKIWSAMIQRCCNCSCREYTWYGSRGITICDRWLEANGFAHFLADLGPRPHPRASLHRVDNDGNYEPGNVVWANPRIQSRHRRSNHVLTYNGRSMIIADWAEELGMKPITLSQRLRYGWTVEDALTLPVEPRRPYAEWVRRKAERAKTSPKPRHPASPACQPATPPGLALAAQRSTGNATGGDTPSVA